MQRLSLAAFFLAISSARADSDNTESRYFSTYKPAGLQSGPDAVGSTYVSAALYSADDNSVVITGSTWGRFFESPKQILDEDYDMYGTHIDNPRIVTGCFLASAALPGTTAGQSYGYEGGTPESLFWSHRQRLRMPSANEACNAVHLFEDTSTVMVAGHSEERVNVTISPGVIREETTQFGMLLAEQWNVEGDKSFVNKGGQMLSASSLIYPVAMTSQSASEEDGLFVVFMEAANSAKHIDVQEGKQPHDPTKYFDYGAGYGFSVARFDLKANKISAKTTTTMIQQTWQKPYDTTDDFRGQVYVTDILHVATGLLVMVGTTNGQGPAFGAETDQGKDLDGFLAKISPATGELIVDPGVASSYRIQSNNNKHGNDWVAGACYDPQDSDHHVYIAGTTEGKMAQSTDTVKGTSAFLMKFDVLAMQPVWTKQLGAETTSGRAKSIVRGMACAVTPDGESVWLGGIVEEGGVISQSGLKKSFGGKDIFIARIDTYGGQSHMVKQMGSAKDDELALRGGLVTDNDGNAVLVGNTYGSFYRTRTAEETSSDVFVLTISLFDGNAAVGSSATSNKESNNSSSSSFGNIGIVLLSVSLVAVLAASALFVNRKIKGPVVTNRSHVTPYLGGFDLEDVELKHSATGGWHCNFVNKLSEGKFVSRKSYADHQERPVVTTAHNQSGELPDVLMRMSLTADSSNKDLMYCDADPMDLSSRSTGSLLHGGEPGSVYGDLVEAYNNTWAGPSRKRDSDKSSNELRPSWGKEII